MLLHETDALSLQRKLHELGFNIVEYFVQFVERFNVQTVAVSNLFTETFVRTNIRVLIGSKN